MVSVRTGAERCPECRGTGFVFVMTGSEGEMPLKYRFDRFEETGRQRCGVCGGDGVLEELGGWVEPLPGEVWPPEEYPESRRQRLAEDWFLDEKYRLANSLDKVSE